MPVFPRLSQLWPCGVLGNVVVAWSHNDLADVNDEQATTAPNSFAKTGGILRTSLILLKKM